MSAEHGGPQSAQEMHGFNHAETRSVESEPLDEEWFGEFVTAGGKVEAYSIIDPDRKALNKEAIFKRRENPILTFPNLHVEEVQDHHAKLVALKTKIQASTDKPQEVKDLYIDRIVTKIREKEMLLAASEGDSQTVCEKSIEVYEDTDPQVVAYTVIEHTT